MPKSSEVILAEIQTKLNFMSEDMKEIKSDIKDIKQTSSNNKERVSKLETKMGILTLAQSGLSVLMGAVASWIGFKK